jgi:hypothetical protein
MAEQMADRVGKLEKLARAERGPLSVAELKLVRAASQGVMAWCGPTHLDDDPDNNPLHANDTNHEWDPDRHIEAELIRWICADRRARDLVDPVGIAIHAAEINGELRLDYIAIPFPITFLRCAIVNDASFRAVRATEMNFDGCWVKALVGDGVTVAGSVLLRDGFRADGQVAFRGAQIGGDLDCAGGQFINPTDGKGSEGVALSASGITVQGDVLLRRGFRAEGEVRLRAARIEGSLSCVGGTFINPPRAGKSGDALTMHLASVRGTVFLTDGFRAEGATRLLTTQIGGNLECDGGVFRNPYTGVSGSGEALIGDGMTVKGNVYLQNRFSAEGEVSLLDAQIGATLGCIGGVFRNPRQGTEGTGRALTADRSNIKGDVFVSDGFIAEGRVRFPGAHIGGDLHSRDGRLLAAELDLRGASVSALWDNLASWPNQGNLYVDGFVDARIADGPADATTRLKWLSLQRAFTTQPYLQLAKVIRDGGDENGAQQVLITMEDRGWDNSGDRHWTDPLVRWPLEVTVGYGYDPLRAFWEVLGLSALGWIVYRRSYLASRMVPTDDKAYHAFHTDAQLPPSYSRFSPAIYSLENSLPLVKLGQAAKWQPQPTVMNNELPAQTPRVKRSSAQAGPARAQVSGRFLGHHVELTKFVTFLTTSAERCMIYIGLLASDDPERQRSRVSQWGTSPRFVLWFLWSQILLGWLLATLFVAGISGIVRRH